MKHQPVQILLVEDSASDAELTIDAFRGARVHNAVHRVCDGVEGLEYLRAPRPTQVGRPDLIVLDLNMPRMDGHEFLQVVKADADLRDIPVVVLTTSQAERDIVRSYREHANCYVSKPVELEQFTSVVQEIGNFWLDFVKLPSLA